MDTIKFIVKKFNHCCFSGTIDLVVGNRSFSINFSAKITTNRKDIASSALNVYNDISGVETLKNYQLILLFVLYLYKY